MKVDEEPKDGFPQFVAAIQDRGDVLQINRIEGFDDELEFTVFSDDATVATFRLDSRSVHHLGKLFLAESMLMGKPGYGG